MWVNVVSTRSDDNKYRLNLGVALGIREYDDRFEVSYAGDGKPYGVKKTPEMIEAYNSLVPEKSQPVRPAEPKPEEPFRITGLGLYEMENGERVHITVFDDDDPDTPWCSDGGKWYDPDGTYHGDHRSPFRIVKLIKLDEVQP